MAAGIILSIALLILMLIGYFYIGEYSCVLFYLFSLVTDRVFVTSFCYETALQTSSAVSLHNDVIFHIILETS